MMQEWWFRLYSRPFLKRLLQLFAATLVGDLIFTHSGNIYGINFYLLPLFALLLKFSPGSFRENIEFHKTSVPFKELRWAFLLDVLLTSSSYLFLLGVAIKLSHSLGGFFSLAEADAFWELTWSMIFYYSFTLFLGISWVCFIAVDKKYIFYGLKHRSFWQKVFFAGPIWLLCFSFMILGLFMGFAPELSYTFMLGALMTGSACFTLKAMFHKGPTHASIGRWLMYFGLGNIVIGSIFFVSCLMGRNDVFKESFSVKTRIESFTFYAIFAPKVDMKTFKAIEPHMDQGDRVRIYKKVAFDPSGVGLQFFLDGSKEELRLLTFLTYGKPSIDFLLSLYSSFMNKHEFWDRVVTAEQIRFKAFHRWPQDKRIPEKYITEKKKADDFAELKKLKRSMASGR